MLNAAKILQKHCQKPANCCKNHAHCCTLFLFWQHCGDILTEFWPNQKYNIHWNTETRHFISFFPLFHCHSPQFQEEEKRTKSVKNMKHLRQFEISSYGYICVFKINPYVCWEFFEKKTPDWRRPHDFS